ncbi:MAG: MBL fold metallo-hydrolase [Verrucomicrobia subdivision 3 bacterium]|nr:MBL fold metallo-hydrolase [Limisphaerales bacterium]
MKRMLLALVVLLNWNASARETRGLDIYWVDVEGGAATLIVTPAGESILIDTGNPGTRDAERIHAVATQQAKLKKIDFLITTHFHGDHFGGAAPLSQLMPIGMVYDNGIPVRSPDRNRRDPAFILKVRPYKNMKVDGREIVQPGAKLPLQQLVGALPVELTFVAAARKFIAAPKGAKKNPLAGSVPAKSEDLSDNANSVASLITVGGFRFLDCGDLTWNMEAKLVEPVNRVGTVDVYQVNHHGLATSNNPVLIKSVAPTVSVMNNGHTKGCSPTAFAALTSTKSIQAMYQVHKNLRADGKQNNTAEDHIANLGEPKDCKAIALKMSVAADGKSYTIFNPRNNHQQTFKTRQH